MLNKKIVDIACATSSSLARITGAVAAMADPPQMDVPTPIRVVVLPSIFIALPTKYAVRNEALSVNTITANDCPPTLITLSRFISKPKRTMEYCKIYLQVNLIPESSASGLLKKAKIIPISIPNTGPPIIGNVLPKRKAGIANKKQIPIPGNIFELKNLLFIKNLLNLFKSQLIITL